MRTLANENIRLVAQMEMLVAERDRLVQERERSYSERQTAFEEGFGRGFAAGGKK